MIDQIVIGDRASFDDFGASVAKRGGNPPKKKTIKETVPFSNITHDFTKINGEIYWEERELEYVFEMIAPTPERLEEMKTALSNWLMNIINEELHDPIVPDYHYLATYDDMSFDDEEGMEKTTATVTFTAYPYKIANYPKVYEFSVRYNGTMGVTVLNESSHRITPRITADNAIEINLNGVTLTMSEEGTIEDEALKLNVGLNTIRLTNYGTEYCNVTISFNEEVF